MRGVKKEVKRLSGKELREELNGGVYIETLVSQKGTLLERRAVAQEKVAAALKESVYAGVPRLIPGGLPKEDDSGDPYIYYSTPDMKMYLIKYLGKDMWEAVVISFSFSR